MRKIRTTTFAASLAAAFSPSIASAHTDISDTAGFFHGFEHPVGGLDHVLAMVLVGIVAWQVGGRALYPVPATFVLLMAIGGGVGMAGMDVPFVELGIALSVIVLGLAVAFRFKAPVLAMVPLVGLFAIFHGHAHGAEMPENAAGLAYGLGFMFATALLHLAGVGLGFVFAKTDEKDAAFVRIGGGATALAGFAILAGAL